VSTQAQRGFPALRLSEARDKSRKQIVLLPLGIEGCESTQAQRGFPALRLSEAREKSRKQIVLLPLGIEGCESTQAQRGFPALRLSLGIYGRADSSLRWELRSLDQDERM